MGLAQTILFVALGLVGLVAIAGGIAYAADAPVDATITDKSCAGTSSTVTVVTDMFGIEHTLEMAPDKCAAIQKGNFVRYHLRSQHTIIYASKGGACLFDSETIACKS
jgi:hypothetical protein